MSDVRVGNVLDMVATVREAHSKGLRMRPRYV